MKPFLKLYRGYANEQELIVMGHVFNSKIVHDYDFKKNNFKNAKAIINLFQAKTKANTDVYLKYKNSIIHTKTLDDGYFKFCIPVDDTVGFGWIDYEVSIIHNNESIFEKGSYIRPNQGSLGIISDIDDTFIVSHTSNPLKKLYVLLFKNINNRKIYQNVVSHYQALSTSGRNNKNEQNAFFYVSSSEWNLYTFIIRFTEIHQMPRAVLLLKDIKTSLKDFVLTGRGNHNHKFEKIKHILEFYPNLKYVLLGDDSQDDPFLYANICKIFPVTVKAVYIRQTGYSKLSKVTAALNNLKDLNVEICYFKNSQEAIEHSKKIKII